MDIDQTLKNISVEVFKETGEKIDPYNLAIIRGIVLANEGVVNSNFELAENIKGRLKTYNNTYTNLSPTSALMLKWGFGLWLCILLFIGSCSYFAYQFLKEKESQTSMTLEKREKDIEAFIRKFPKTKKYFD